MKSLIFLTLILSGCGLSKDDKSPLKFKVDPIKKITPIEVDPSKTEEETKDNYYTFLQKEIFQKSCNRCHNAETAVKKGRTDLTVRENIIREFDDIEYRMTQAFDDGFDYMPPKGPKVNENLIKIMQDWKANGFKSP